MKKLVAGLIASGVLALAPLAAPPALAETSPAPDPRLSQTVRSDEGSASGRIELGKGHVDLGPRLTDAGWKLLARDDTATPPTWRTPGDVLIRVHDTAKLAIPDDPQYAFLGLKGGAEAYVVPQTENRQVIWLGWNTQDPKVTQTVDRGAKLVFHRVQGPGSFHVFLQNGFDAPQPLWNGSGRDGQEIWVDVNTHTHANWVFGAPGTYLVDMSVRAEGRDGTTYDDRATLRFAVGDAVAADEAFAATFSEPAPSAAASAPTDSPAASPTPTPSEQAPQQAGLAPWAWASLGAVVVAVGGAAGFGVARSRAARRAAEEDA